MKTDFSLNSAKIRKLKSELSRLTDVGFLKKELTRMADEVRGFDVHTALSPEANRRLRQLESRFHGLREKMHTMQSHVDSEVNKISSMLRRSVGMTTPSTSRKAASATTSKKAVAAGPGKASKKTSKKASKKSSTKQKSKA